MSELMSHIHLGIGSPENDELIAHAGRIPQQSFAISVGVLFGIAASAVTSRIVRRILTLGRLKLDDAFLWLALLCLGAATGCLYKDLFIMMLEDAIPMDPNVVVPINELPRLFASISIIDAFLLTIWTCTFAVKASFLSLFWTLIQGISKRVNNYYWCVVGYTVTTWLFLIAEPFILCPHFGANGAKCYPEDNYPKTLGLTILITILDIASDVMIASIPILLLRKSRMKRKQKLSLALFLCLSLVMVIFALIRVSGLKKGPVVDNTWSLYWQYVEGCVACVMASITPFRTLFVGMGSSSSHKNRKGPTFSLKALFWKRPSKNSADTKWMEMGSENNLPKPPGALLSGIRTFIRRNNRDAGDSTVLVSTTFGIEETISEEPGRDYERYLRKTAGIPQIQESVQSPSIRQRVEDVV
ncbi:hypothetical protein G7Y89_g3982 [Cudoniella acicularis]|uniref:Rhodopsin domain-containing protein n=1 Tax=Cudoniella acicularis TaxID=354080 RepID=A0A8H4RR59_9HELO|nr:hypothetical protein G7Y89_g3982 [Cudoniella acicularis]